MATALFAETRGSRVRWILVSRSYIMELEDDERLRLVTVAVLVLRNSFGVYYRILYSSSSELVLFQLELFWKQRWVQSVVEQYINCRVEALYRGEYLNFYVWALYHSDSFLIGLELLSKQQ